MAGRPRKRSAEEPRQYVGFAVPLAVKGQLEEAARQSGRSLAQECVSRLEQMFLIDRLIGTGLIKVMQTFNHAGSEFAREHGIAGDWAENPDAYGYALAYAVEKLIELYPGPWDEDAVRAMLAGGFDMGRMRRVKALGAKLVWPDDQPDKPAQEDAAA